MDKVFIIISVIELLIIVAGDRVSAFGPEENEGCERERAPAREGQAELG